MTRQKWCIVQQNTTATSLPIENAEGQITNYPLIYFDRIFYYKNKKHLLLSGNLDLLTGRLTSAIFREYLAWEELWP